MSDLNTVVFTGRLGSKPELRYTAAGVPVVNLRVANSRVFFDGKGEKQEETVWLRCAVWGSAAEACAKYLDKGSRIGVSGRLEQQEFVSRKDGQTYSYLQVVVAREGSISFLSPPSVPREDQEEEEEYPDE